MMQRGGGMREGVKRRLRCLRMMGLLRGSNPCDCRGILRDWQGESLGAFRPRLNCLRCFGIRSFSSSRYASFFAPSSFLFSMLIVHFPQARPDLSIQDITALLVSLVNLSLSCYPDKLEYVDQVLSFALSKVTEYSDNPDLHHPTTIQNLLSLLLSPINSYLTVLTLLALPSYQELLLVQPYSTRRSIAHAIVASVLKNETVIETPEDVKGLLELCHVLVRDQRDRSSMVQNHPGAMTMAGGGRQEQRQMGGGGRGQQVYDVVEMAEEQGWIARIVHLFKVDDLEVQFKVSQSPAEDFLSSSDTDY